MDQLQRICKFKPTDVLRCARTVRAGMLALVVLATLFLPLGLSAVQAAAPTTTQIKVAFIYQFTRYIEWPELADSDPRSPFVIGVLGDDPLGTDLDALAIKKSVNGHPIVIRRFNTWQEYTACHILFISETADPQLREQIDGPTEGHSVLIVGETAGFASQGAVVNFYPRANRRVGIELNLQNAKDRGLTINGKLLKIAKVVRE